MPNTHTTLLPRVAEAPTKRRRALTPEQVVELRFAYMDGDSSAVLAERYGISRNTAHRVAVGQLYTDVETPTRLPLVPPTIRERGTHSEDECRQMGRMLRHHVGEWVQVKQGRSKPDDSRYAGFGMDTSVIPIGHDKWGLFVRWAPNLPKVTVTALAG